MSKTSWWDPQAKLIRSQDPAKMTPQQRANWVLLQSVLDAEYQRGREEGRREQSDIDDTLKRNGKTELDIPRTVL